MYSKMMSFASWRVKSERIRRFRRDRNLMKYSIRLRSIRLSLARRWDRLMMGFSITSLSRLLARIMMSCFR